MVVQGNNEQSEHWAQRQNLPLLKEGFHDCWPCREDYPVFPWHSENRQALFEIVTAWGLRTEAWIDDTREFMAEGLEWTIHEGPGKRPRNLPKMQVACWRRIPGRSTPRPRR